MHLLKRAHEVFGDERHARLANISNGQLHRLHGTERYRRKAVPKEGDAAAHREAAPAAAGEAAGMSVSIENGTLHGGDPLRAWRIHHLRSRAPPRLLSGRRSLG